MPSRVLQSTAVDSVALPILDDPVLNCSLPSYNKLLMQSYFILLCWFACPLGLFILAGIILFRGEKFQKPVRTDARISALATNQPSAIELFAPPEEDLIYAGIRKGNQLMTCNFARNNPLQGIIVSIIFMICAVVLLAAISVQASLLVSRDISVHTVNDIVFKSQADDNMICADERFRTNFKDNILARPSAFTYKLDP